MDKLPELFPADIRAWFDDCCDPKVLRPKDAPAFRYRKAPPVTPQRFALPHQIEAVTGAPAQPEERLPPLNKTSLRASLRDVMEMPLTRNSCKRAFLGMMRTPSAIFESQCIGSNASKCSESAGGRIKGSDSLDGLCHIDSLMQPLPTLLATVPGSYRSTPSTLLRTPPGFSANPSLALSPEHSTVTTRLPTAQCATISQLSCSSGEAFTLALGRARRPLCGMSVVPTILERVDVHQPLLAVPPPGGWSDEAAMAMAMEEVRLAALEDQQGESIVARRTTLKHSAAQPRNKPRGESCMPQQEAMATISVETTARMWRTRSVKSGRQSGMTIQSTTIPCSRTLGSHLARGTPTPKSWIKRHGDQRVPLMLTVASNHIPYRLPPTLQSVMNAEREAAEVVAKPPAAESTEVTGLQESTQDVAGTDDAQIHRISKTWSSASKHGDLVHQLCRQTSARSVASNSSFWERNQEAAGSMQQV